MEKCPWCSDDVNGVHHTGKCPKVKAIEYHENSEVKRVEFFGPSDYPVPFPVLVPNKPRRDPSIPQPPYEITIGDSTTWESKDMLWIWFDSKAQESVN